MARITKKDDMKPTGETIINMQMEQIVHESMMPYAEYVILERALPRVEDGLKPVQRRILYTMHELGMTPDKPHKKCARVVGDCLGKYHPHGDGSVYDALVRMAQDFNMSAPLVDGHGNFGSIDGDRAAAIRYTECRLAPPALDLIEGIEKNTVEFSLNFDDSLKEPDMLPGGFPNLLVNGSNGIAVGLATNIPPHNMGEAIDCVIAQIDEPDISVEKLLTILKGPDFPTGGLIVGGDSLVSVYTTGRGRVLVRAKAHIEDGASGRKLIVITELPYQVNKATLLANILKLSEARKDSLGGIYDIRDESDRTGIRAVIELKKDTDAARALSALFKYSDMQVTFGVNMVAIAGGKPLTMGLRQINECYINHRRTVVAKALRYELDGALARAHILDGLIIAVDNIDEVIRIIRSSKTPKEAKERLVAAFRLSETQAQAILDLRLQRLTGLEIEALRKELAELEKRIAQLEAILASEKKLLKVVKDQLTQVKMKHPIPRRTGFANIEDEPAPEQEPRAAAPMRIVLMANGCFKRFAPKANLTSEDLGGAVAKQVTATERLYVITDGGTCHTLSPEQIPECRPKDRGLAFTGVLAGLKDGERPVSLISDIQDDSHVIFVTAQGAIKRVSSDGFGLRRGKAGIISLKEGDSLVFAGIVADGSTLMIVSKKGMVIHIDPSDAHVMGKSAAGVRGMSLDAGDAVLAAFLAKKGDEVMLMSDRGYAKRMLYVDFDIQKRAGKGVKAFPIAKNGTTGLQVAGAVLLSPDAQGQSILVEQKGGQSTAISPDEIMIEPRAAKGSPYVMALLDDPVTSVSVQMA